MVSFPGGRGGVNLPGGGGGNTANKFSGSIFGIGIDNINFGQAEYKQKSIYISKPTTITDPCQIVLKAIEKRPASESITLIPEMTDATYDDDGSTFYHCSIEYYVFKVDYDDKNNVISTYKIPILPTGVTTINHERLILKDKSSTTGIFLPDVGSLMFYAFEDTANLKVYRNGTLMKSTEWSVISTANDETPNTGVPMKTKIKINSLLPGDIFTVSYNPSESSTISIPTTLTQFSASGINVVDLTGDLTARLVSNKAVLLDKGANSDKIKKTDIHCAIILRNNVGATSLTPVVEEFNLVLGERDPSKFLDDTF